MLHVKSYNKGFTMVELMLIIIMFAVMFGATSVIFGDMLGKQSLEAKGHEVVQTFREAHINAVTQKNDSRWGVYLDISTDPDSYVFYKGDSYASRNPKSDILTYLPKTASFTSINLGGVNEVVFEKRSGLASNSGSFSIINDNQQFDIIINSLGLIDFNNG